MLLGTGTAGPTSRGSDPVTLEQAEKFALSPKFLGDAAGPWTTLGELSQLFLLLDTTLKSAGEH